MSNALLVDDEPRVLFTRQKVLVDRGHSVVTARSAAEALTRLDAARRAIFSNRVVRTRALRRAMPRIAALAITKRAAV